MNFYKKIAIIMIAGAALGMFFVLYGRDETWSYTKALCYDLNCDYVGDFYIQCKGHEFVNITLLGSQMKNTMGFKTEHMGSWEYVPYIDQYAKSLCTDFENKDTCKSLDSRFCTR